jgi:23S rRNA (adenine2503-C2)-methyltransferase
MSDLPAGLREALDAALPLWRLSPVSERATLDRSTVKVLFRLPDGSEIEAVRMLGRNTGGGTRTTVCVSSQAGCAYACAFCATGQGGYGRNLSAGEIVEQVVRLAGDSGGQSDLTNIVFMGMGEPFANYEAVLAAIRAINAPWGLGLGARHITVSTVGLVPEILRFAAEPLQLGLAVSLHAPTDGLRDRLMPVNRKYPLAELLAACRRYIETTKRRVTFEYVLLDGVNDGPEHAAQLGALLSGLLCHLNLIPNNPTPDGPFGRPDLRTARAFLEHLRAQGVATTLRATQGVEIQAACGQLQTAAQPRAAASFVAPAIGPRT